MPHISGERRRIEAVQLAWPGKKRNEQSNYGTMIHYNRVLPSNLWRIRGLRGLGEAAAGIRVWKLKRTLASIQSGVVECLSMHDEEVDQMNVDGMHAIGDEVSDVPDLDRVQLRGLGGSIGPVRVVEQKRKVEHWRQRRDQAHIAVQRSGAGPAGDIGNGAEGWGDHDILLRRLAAWASDDVEFHDIVRGRGGRVGQNRIRMRIVEEEAGPDRNSPEIHEHVHSVRWGDGDVAEQNGRPEVATVGADLQKLQPRVAEEESEESRIRSVQNAQSIDSLLHIEVGPCFAIDQNHVARVIGAPLRMSEGGKPDVGEIDGPIGEELSVLDDERDLEFSRWQEGRILRLASDDVESRQASRHVQSRHADGVIVVP